MASKIFQISEWARALDQADNEDDLNGLSPGGAAERLGVTRQTVYNLLKRGDLDRVTIVDSEGKKFGVIITNASLLRYQEKESQQDLLTSIG
jgi:hypothetical protein